LYGTAARLRTLGPGGATFSDLDDSTLEFYLSAASEKFDSYVGKRGYDVALSTYGLSLELSVYQVASWMLLVGVRGVNPADPAHAALAKSHDDAVLWWRDVAKGLANLKGDAPARLSTGTARVISTTSCGTGSTRGW
jgi:hypothetical protein